MSGDLLKHDDEERSLNESMSKSDCIFICEL